MTRTSWAWWIAALALTLGGCPTTPSPGLDDDSGGPPPGDDDTGDDDTGDDDDGDDDTGDDDTGDDDTGDDDTGPPEPYDSPVVGRVQGVVTTPDGQPIEGVTVRLGPNASELTNADGAYRLDGIEPDGLLHLTFAKFGYTTDHGRTELRAWETRTVNASLLPVDTLANVSGTAGGEVVSDDLRLLFPQDAFVDQLGQPVTGAVQVSATHVDPTGPELRAAPGDTRALDSDDYEVGLRSYGMAEITLSANGSPVSLAAGQTVAMEFLLPEGLPADQASLGAGDTLHTWWFDDDLQRWLPGGEALVGVSTSDPGRLAAFAEADHFTWWNIDWAYTLTCVQGRVTDVAGHPIEGAQVWAEGISYAGSTVAETDADGHYVIWPVSTDASVQLLAEVTIAGQAHDVTSGTVQTSGTVLPDGGVQGYQATLADILAQGHDLSACDSQPDLVIPTCVMAGEVTLMQQDIFNPLAPGKVITHSGANAYFYEPDGTADTCAAVEPLDLPVDSCAVVSQDDAFFGLTGGQDPVDAGALLHIRDDALALDLERVEREPGDVFYESTSSQAVPFDAAYDVYAYGAQGGIPEMQADAAVVLGDRMTVTFPPASQTVQITRGQPLPVLSVPSEDSWGMALLLVPDDNAQPAVVCRCEDDGEFLVPGDMTAQLPTGPVGLMVGRAVTDTAHLPTGYSIRTIGVTGAVLVGEVD